MSARTGGAETAPDPYDSPDSSGPTQRTRLEARLRSQGLDPGAWSNGPGERYPSHAHAYDKVLVVSDGSITFGLPASGATVGLDVGDRLDLPAGTDHDAVVGPTGVTCLEAHRPAGTLGATASARGRTW